MSSSVRASRTNDFLKLKLLPLSILAALAGLGTPQVYAACTTAGSNVSCSGAANPLAPSYANGANNLNVTVNPGGSVGVLLGVGGNAMTLTGSNDTLTNNGRIDPTLLGNGLGVLSSGVVMGNASASTQTVTNNGIMGGTTGLSIGLTGMALAVQNGAGGTTNITNTGVMSTSGIIGATLLGPDAGVVAAYGGGQVNVDNSGTIIGRVALGSSAGGNTFTNSGTVNGSVSLGANSANQFIATTDSSVNSAGGTGLATNLGIGAVTINFAATGTVDGGAGGNNTLSLQQGFAATGTINNGNYTNFNHLDVQSGTWNLNGASSALDATLGNGATAVVNNTASLGTGTITATGGAIQSAAPGLTLGNDITTTGLGLGVTGASSLTLSGTISGSGGVTKSGSGTLTLTGANDYTGGTALNNGTLVVGNDLALGTGPLTVGGNATLDGSQAIGLGNDIAVNSGASLTLGGSNAMSIGGDVSGDGGLVKNGAATVTLTGANTYTGGTTINSGTLALGAGGSLAATGAVNLAGVGAGFDISGSGADQTIGGLAGAAGTVVSLGGNALTFGDASNQTFGGTIGGTGGVVKQGSGIQTLTGTNTYIGGTTINGGTLALGAGGSLAATGDVTLGTAGAGFDISGAGANQTIGGLSGVAGTNVALGGNSLTFGTAADQTYAGSIGGTGGIVKQGSGTQTLSGVNAYTGGTTINAGTLAISGGGSLAATGTVNLANAGTVFDISGATSNQSIGGLAGAAGSNVVLGANTLSFGDVGNHTFGGVIEGTGGITKVGSGTQTLTGVNTYTGATTINAGTLVLGAGSSLAAASDVNLGGAGAELDLSGAGAAQTIGGLSGVAGTTVSLGGNALTFGDEVDRTFGGSITGTAGITKQGMGKTTLTGANAYTGGTTINAGTLALGAGGSLAAGGSVTLAAAGAGFDIGDSGANQTIGALSGVGGTTIALGANTLTFGDASNQGFGGVISGTGSIVKQGAGTQTLTGVNTHTGGTTINAGTLAIGAGGSLSGQGTVNLANAGTAFDISGATSNQTIGGLAGAAGSSVALGANTLSFGDAGNHTFGGIIGGTGGITKEGSGTQTLTGVNTYTGTTTINAGTLALGAGGSLAATSDVNLGGAGAAFDISGAGAAQTIGGLSGVAGTTVSLGGNALTFGDEADRTFGGSITGTAGITKQGAGKTTLTGANAYTGGTTINGGTLAIGAGGSLAATGNMTLGASGATFDISGATTPQTIAGLSGVAGTTLALGANTLTFGDTAARSYAGTITGTGGLVKQGSGSVTLTSANTYTGGTTINAGTVALGAGGSLAGTGLVTLANAGAGFDISASGANQTIGGLAGAAGTTVALGTHTLTLGNASNQAFGGVIGGTGGLVKQGVGTMTLTGANTYTGATEIKAGTLALGAGGSLASGGGVNLSGAGAAFDIANSGANQTLGSLAGVAGTTVALGTRTLTVGNAAEQAYAGSITGTGGLVKQGTGTLTLAGANTYSGGTTINAGTLALGAGGSLASMGSLDLNGTSTFDISASGADQTVGGFSGAAGTKVVLGPNRLIFGDATDQQFAGVISGAGGIVKQGSGTQTLTGANTYTGGTRVAAGTLVGDSTSLQGDIDNAATLVFDQPTNGTYGGQLSGAGTLVKDGAGVLTLAGANTYSGGTRIDLGTLQGDASSLRGDIQNNANLVFQQQTDGAYAGTLTGMGALAKDGAGTLTVSADSGAYAGSTAVRAGTLQVDGKLGGTVAVQSGGTLSGTGTVGGTTIASGATLAPGNAAAPKGTLTVAGNLVFSPGATYQVRTDPTGAQSMVHATGTASLAGGVLILGDEGNYALSTNYNILTADGGLLGRFDSVRSNLAFLTPDLQYTTTGIGLAMSLKDVDDGGSTPSRPIRFADLAENGNQRATANALQSLPSSSNLYSRVLNLPEGAPAGVFASLSGEAHASVQQSLQNVGNRVMDTSISHLRANLNAAAQPGAPTAQLGRGDASALPQSAVKPAWVQVFGGWSRQSGGGDTARVSESSGGVFLGGDGDVGGGWRLGGAFGYADGNANLRSLSSSTDLNSYSAAIYGGKAFPTARGQVNVSLGAGYTWHDVKTKRNVNAAGVSQELKADYGASTAQVFGEVGYAIKLDQRYTLEPFVGAGYSDVRTRAFSESGGDAALRGESNSNRTATTTLGLHGEAAFDSAGAPGRLRATVGWRHAYGDVDPQATLAFQNSQSFTVKGASIARDAAVVELGVDMAVSKRTTVGLTYAGQYGSGAKQSGGSLDVRFRF